MADRKPNSKKQARAEKAQRHAEQMAARLGKEIERSLAGVPVSYTHLDVYKRQLLRCDFDSDWESTR